MYRLQAKTTLEMDLDILSGKGKPEGYRLPQNEYYALLYRTENKKIIKAQLELMLHKAIDTRAGCQPG